MRLLAWVCRLAVASVFIVSGVAKLEDPARLLLDTQAFRLVPYPVAYGVALFLPWAELFAAVTLFMPHLRRGGAVLLFVMTAGFIAALLLAQARGVAVDCGCFGALFEFPNLAAHLAFNAALMAAVLTQLGRPRGPS